MLAELLKGPSAYVPRNGWPAWAVLPAGLGILVLAIVLGGLLVFLFGALSTGTPIPANIDPTNPPPQLTKALVLWIVGLQTGTIVLTYLAAGFFATDRHEALALKPPAQGWGVLGLALVPLFLVGAVWTFVILQWKPTTVLQDLRPFQTLLDSEARWLVVLIICVGAPLSEEILFRGFLFSGLAKSRLGVVGATLITAGLWTGLHAGYSMFGLVEVLGIGLYLSWLLVRTGSLWVTIFCHAAYNTAVTLVLLFIALPAPAA